MEQMKIVCIGNSIINGFPLKRSQCFVSLWRQATGHEIINKGENGDVTSNVIVRFEKNVMLHKPDAAVVLTGTNDFIYQVASPEEVLGFIDRMVSLSREHSVRIILMTPLLLYAPLAEKCWIPDVDYPLVNEKLKKLCGLMLDYGEKNDIEIINTQERFLRLYTEENAAEYLCDGLHPTALGHEAIAGFLQDFSL